MFGKKPPTDVVSREVSRSILATLGNDTAAILFKKSVPRHPQEIFSHRFDRAYLGPQIVD
ncbi:hypothetical+protein [Methylocapsa aurea]|jgi:hypothetical protein